VSAGKEVGLCADILERMTDAYLALDREWMVINANTQAERLLGRSKAELIGRNIWEVFPESVDTTFYHHLRDALEEDVEVAFEEHCRPSGKWVEVRAYPSDEGLSVYFQDITRLRQAEQAFQRYQILSRYARDIILFVHADGRIIEANEAALRTYGYAPEELRNLTIWDLRAPETHQESIEQMAWADAAGILFETVHRRKDGSTFPVEVSSQGAEIDGERVLLSIVRDISKRKAVEEALRESEECLRAISSATFEGIVIHRGGRVVATNQAIADMFGYDISELIDSDPLRLIAPEYWAIARSHIAEESPEPYEILAVRKDGSRFPAEVRGRNIIYKGQNTRATAIRDITERKRAEEALEAERARLQAVLESLPVAVSLADATGKVVQTNAAAARIWGSTEPLAGEHGSYSRRKGFWADSGKPLKAEDWALVRAVTRGEVSTGEVIDIERFDGTRGTIVNSAAPVRDREGRIIGAVAVSQDVTDLRVAEEEMRRSRDLLQSIIDNTPAAIYVKNLDGVIIVANQALADLFGLSKEDLIGKTSYEVYPRDIADQHTANDREIMARGEAITFEEVAPEDGSVRTFLSIKFPLKDEDGHVYGIGGVSTDITERVRAAAEIREALERESYFSLQLQKALLPPAPVIGEGYSVAHAYQSPYEGREIGGDFYDVFPTEAGKVAIMIGDVSGKGLEAASVAAATRSTVRAFAYELSSAGEALTHANAIICAQQPSGEFTFFVTVFLAILDLPTGVIWYSSAGHPPPAIYHAKTDSVEFPEQADPPIGLLSQYDFREGTAVLESGDRLVLYTDGLSEARHDGEMFEIEGIERVLREMHAASAAEIVEALMSSATEWAAGRLHDDTALVVIGRH